MDRHPFHPGRLRAGRFYRHPRWKRSHQAAARRGPGDTNLLESLPEGNGPDQGDTRGAEQLDGHPWIPEDRRVPGQDVHGGQRETGVLREASVYKGIRRSGIDGTSRPPRLRPAVFNQQPDAETRG